MKETPDEKLKQKETDLKETLDKIKANTLFKETLASDISDLKRMGVAAIFLPGSDTRDIVRFLQQRFGP